MSGRAAVSIFTNNLIATVCDSSFVRNIGGALLFFINNAATVRLEDDDFLENSASYGGIVYALTSDDNPAFNFHANNVSFVQNKLPRNNSFGILDFRLRSTTINISLKNTRFFGNLNMAGGSFIAYLPGKSWFRSGILDTCMYVSREC